MWTKVIDFRPNGHAYFIRDEGLAIADDSGRYPEDTDDGVLWVDENNPIGFCGEHTVVRLTCGYHSPISGKEAAWLLKKYYVLTKPLWKR